MHAHHLKHVWATISHYIGVTTGTGTRPHQTQQACFFFLLGWPRKTLSCLFVLKQPRLNILSRLETALYPFYYTNLLLSSPSCVDRHGVSQSHGAAHQLEI